jgi:hypothetical protein
VQDSSTGQQDTAHEQALRHTQRRDRVPLLTCRTIHLQTAVQRQQYKEHQQLNSCLLGGQRSSLTRSASLGLPAGVGQGSNTVTFTVTRFRTKP